MILIQPPVRRWPLQVHAQRMDVPARAAPPDRQNPRKARIDQSWRLRLLRQQPNEFHRAFLPPFDNVDLFRTSQPLVAREPVQGIAKGPAVKRGDGSRIVALDALLAPELQPYGGIAAHLLDCDVESEHLLGCHQDSALLKQPRRKS